jgi:hypothetical protein
MQTMGTILVAVIGGNSARVSMPAQGSGRSAHRLLYLAAVRGVRLRVPGGCAVRLLYDFPYGGDA